MVTQHVPIADQIRDAWDALAPGFDQFITDEAMASAQRVLDRLPSGPDMRVLDIGCGSGAVSIPVARRGARVTAIDRAPTMVDRLVIRARAEGLDDVEGRVMDAQALDLPDDTCDLAASQNGVSLLPDLHAGPNEVVRVTVQLTGACPPSSAPRSNRSSTGCSGSARAEPRWRCCMP